MSQTPICIVSKTAVAVVATVVALVTICNHFSGSYQKEVEKDPKQELTTAIEKTLQEKDGAGYTPLKTGAEAAQSGVITATTTNKAGENVTYKLVQDPARKRYASARTAAHTGWQWQLIESIANVQAGDVDSDWYCVDMADPAAAAERLTALRNSLGLSVEEMEEKLRGNYSAFLTAYNANSMQSDSMTNVTNTILSYVPKDDVSVRKAKVTTRDGDKIDTIQVKYTVPNEQMEQMVSDIQEMLRDRDSDYAAYVNDIFHDVLIDAGCDFYEVTGSKEDSIAEKKWGETLNKLQIYLALSDADFTVAFNLSTKTKNVVAFSAMSSDTINDEKVTAEVSVELPMSYEGKYDAVFTMRVIGEKKDRFSNDLTITESVTNDASAYCRNIMFMYQDGLKSFQESYTREYDKKNNTFGICTVWNGKELEVSGSATVMGTEMRMDITKAVYDGTAYELAVSVSADTQVGEWFNENAIPNAAKIEDLSEGELAKLQAALAKHLPADRFGDWSEQEVDLSKYQTFDPKFDYDGDGDCGDADDRFFYNVMQKMYGLL